MGLLKVEKALGFENIYTYIISLIKEFCLLSSMLRESLLNGNRPIYDMHVMVGRCPSSFFLRKSDNPFGSFICIRFLMKLKKIILSLQHQHDDKRVTNKVVKHRIQFL